MIGLLLRDEQGILYQPSWYEIKYVPEHYVLWITEWSEEDLSQADAEQWLHQQRGEGTYLRTEQRELHSLWWSTSDEKATKWLQNLAWLNQRAEYDIAEIVPIYGNLKQSWLYLLRESVEHSGYVPLLKATVYINADSYNISQFPLTIGPQCVYFTTTRSINLRQLSDTFTPLQIREGIRNDNSTGLIVFIGIVVSTEL